MVAAINLATAGYQVIVMEAEKDIGGSPLLHPSIHITPINKNQVWEYIGINLDNCFVNPETFPMYLGDKRHLAYPEYMFLVERGPRPASLVEDVREPSPAGSFAQPSRSPPRYPH